MIVLFVMKVTVYWSIHKLLVKSFILSFEQTACQTDPFLLTDQFYNCFVSDRCFGLLGNGAHLRINEDYIYYDTVTVNVSTAQRDHHSVNIRQNALFRVCVPMEIKVS